MEQRDRDIIRSNFTSLGKELNDVIENICVDLFATRILNDAMKQDILSKPTPLSQSYHLLGIITRRGPKAFPALYEACKNQELFTACDILMPDQAPHEPCIEEEPTELETDSIIEPQIQDEIDPWDTPDSYYDKIIRNKLLCQPASKDKYKEHIGNKQYYQFTGGQSKGQMYILYDGADPFLMDRKILDCFCHQLNFDTPIVKRIREPKHLEELKFKPNRDCLMIFVMASGQNGFFNIKEGSGRKLLERSLKDNQGLVGKPKLIFQMNSNSIHDKSNEKSEALLGKVDSFPGAKERIGEAPASNVKEGMPTQYGSTLGNSKVVSDDNEEVPLYSDEKDPLGLVTSKISKVSLQQEADQDKSLCVKTDTSKSTQKAKQKSDKDTDNTDTVDGPTGSGPTGSGPPRESDILTIEVTEYGCEVLELAGCDLEFKHVTRFVHLLVDVFFKHAKSWPLFDLIGIANRRSAQNVAVCKTTGRKKLYFFPGW